MHRLGPRWVEWRLFQTPNRRVVPGLPGIMGWRHLRFYLGWSSKSSGVGSNGMDNGCTTSTCAQTDDRAVEIEVVETG